MAKALALRVDRWWAVLALFGAIGCILFVLTQLNVEFLDFTTVPPHPFPDRRGFDGWTRWDTGWYQYIAEHGYYFSGSGQQSPVAFFPAYPAAMRVVAAVVGDVLVAGVLLTFAAGAAASVLFHRWCQKLLGAPTARLGVVLLLTYPFAFYLFGVVYSDALFLAAAIAAFLLLEHDRPVLAGLVGMVATGARPVGVAVIFALVVRALERQGCFERGASMRERLRRVRLSDIGVGLSAGGLLAFCLLLWIRFRAPFAFAEVGSAPGWHRQLDLHTVLKIDFIDVFSRPSLSPVHIGLAIQAIATVLALALTPVIVRRLGWGYAAYTVVAVALPAMTSKDFIGMGRYVLVAFPCFAAGASLLVGGPTRTSGSGTSPRPVVVAAVVGLNVLGLVLMHSYFVRWYFLS